MNEIVGWVEVSDKKYVYVGNLGFKVYRYKKDIIAAGFSKDEIAKVKVILLP